MVILSLDGLLMPVGFGLFAAMLVAFDRSLGPRGGSSGA